MRMRRKKNLDIRMERCSDIWLKPEEGQTTTDPYVTEAETLHLEIGCGKGGFIEELAKQNPTVRYLAVERFFNVLVMAMERTKTAELQNIRFLSVDAQKLTEILPKGCISRIYLNFSDPWPGKRQAKRRLTAPQMLELYKTLLAPNGEIFMKTDSEELFLYSTETLDAAGFRVQNVTFDLHQSVFNKDNIMTEYEKNFTNLGKRIMRLEAVKTD